MSAKISTTKSKHTTTNAAHKRNVFFFLIQSLLKFHYSFVTSYFRSAAGHVKTRQCQQLTEHCMGYHIKLLIKIIVCTVSFLLHPISD